MDVSDAQAAASAAFDAAAALRAGELRLRWPDEIGRVLQPGDFWTYAAAVARPAGASFESAAVSAAVMEWRESYSAPTRLAATYVYWDEETAEDFEMVDGRLPFRQGDLVAAAFGTGARAVRGSSQIWSPAVKVMFNLENSLDASEAAAGPVEVHGKGLKFKGAGLFEERQYIAYVRI